MVQLLAWNSAVMVLYSYQVKGQVNKLFFSVSRSSYLNAHCLFSAREHIRKSRLQELGQRGSEQGRTSQRRKKSFRSRISLGQCVS